eukprot:GEMP01015307.1.p1 GENE.GEMP01015307.1~~GEMP01015307.1.p1  ORF type:complete len:786 (+),score=160.89 GEMP01015307.1:109-2358(+)
MSHVIQTELMDAGVAVEEVHFDSISEAFKAMRNGQLDVIPETGICVNHGDCTEYCAKNGQCRPCNHCASCSGGIDQTCGPACPPCDEPAPVSPPPLDVESHPWGFSLIEGIFIPNYMADLSPCVPLDWTDASSWTGNATLSDNLHEIIGPLENWGSHSIVDALANASNLDLMVTTPSSASAFHRHVLDHMMWKNRFAFYGFSPHLITAEYPVSMVTLPEKSNGGGAYFTPSKRQMVWRTDINAQAATVLRRTTWSLSEGDMQNAIRNIADHVSLTMDEESTSYGELMRVSANTILCRNGKRNDKCDDITPRFWPREKAVDFPAKIVVSMHHCSGFVNCLAANGTVMDAPDSGYSFDHAKEILRLIGYKESDVVYKCQKGTFTEGIILLSRELAHIGHHCITVMAYRQPLVDFSSSFYSSGLSIAVKAAKPKETLWETLTYLWLSGFELETWGVILIAGIIFIVWIGLFETLHEYRRKKSELKQPPVFRRHLTDTMSTTLYLVMRCIETGADVASGNKSVLQLRSHWARFGAVFLAVLWFLTLTVYAANLTATKTSELQQVLKIAGRESLRGQTAVTDCDSSMGMWLRAYEPDIHLLCTSSLSEMKAAVLNGSAEALIADTPLVERLVAEDCRFRMGGKSFAAQDYGVTFPKNSPLLKPISAAVTYLREKEEWHAEFYAKHFMGKCSNEDADATQAEDDNALNQSLSILHVVGLLIPSCVVLMLSFLAKLSHYSWSRKSKKRRSQKSTAI